MLELTLASAILAVPAFSDELEPGFRSVNLASAGPGHVYATLPDGNWLGLDDDSLELFDAAGTLIRPLFAFSSPLPPQYVAVDPTQTYAVVGRWDGGVGGSYRISLNGAPNPFWMPFVVGQDAVFADADRMILAGLDGVGGFSMVEVNIQTGASRAFSGTFGGSYAPVAVDGNGNLYTAHFWFGDTLIERFSPAQIAGFSVAPGNGTVIDQGYGDVVDLAVSVDGTVLYVGENPLFGPGPSRIIQNDLLRHRKTTLLSFPPPEGLGRFELFPAMPPAEFLPYQPPSAGRIVYHAGQPHWVRRSLEPARPALGLNGMGTMGVGPFDLEVTGGPPLGYGVVFYGPLGLYSAHEIAIPLRIPLFVGLDLSTALSAPGLVLFDAAGTGRQSYVNASGATGLWAIQVILFDPSSALAGSSSAAFL